MTATVRMGTATTASPHAPITWRWMSSIIDQQSPYDAGHLVGQGHGHILGLQASIWASHDPLGAPRRLAATIGLVSADTLRHQFRSWVGTSLARYRSSFAA